MIRCATTPGRLVLVLGALAVAGGTTGCRKPAEAAPVAAETTKVKVKVTRADVRKVPETLAVSGPLEALLETDLAANASGKVVATYAERGQAVKRGEALFKLDTRLAGLQAAASRAQADVSQADLEREKRECDRMAQLIAAGAVPQAEADRQSARCKVAERAAAAQKANAQVAAQVVADGRVSAPFAGHVVERWVDVGEYVRADTRVATLVQLDPLRVKIAVPESHLAHLVTGRRVALRVPAFPGKTFDATVTRVSPAVRAQTRDVVAEAEVPNKDHALLPGMFASADLEVGARDLPLVPKTSIVLREGATHVFVLVDGHVEERAVQVGPEVGDRAAIVRGVAPGEMVVDAPGDLKNGAAAEAS